jgi:hypothetical protein
MAQAKVQFFSFSWVGNSFYPGVEHPWAWGPLSSVEVWQVVAIPLRGAPWPYELMVKDMRVNSAPGTSGVRLLFTVRNMGASPEPVPGYAVHISVVSAL